MSYHSLITKLMQRLLSDYTIFAIFLILAQAPSNGYCQSMGYDQIRALLDANPPATGDLSLRDEAILNLDAHLLKPDVNSNSGASDFYIAQIEDLIDEIAKAVPTGVRIWQMYNHGYLIKTPGSLIAFDLVNKFMPVPDEILRQIDFSFISHSHGDHSDARVQGRIRAFGGEIIRTTNMPSDTGVDFDGIRVVAYNGRHSVPNYIYHITTPEGLTIMHTGDTQHSSWLPSQVPTDILLINAWMNESGSKSATIGVRNGINRVAPSLTIPGHIQELGHLYKPWDPTSRVPYEWALAVDDVPIPGELSVMAWGEVYEYNVVPEPSSCALAMLVILFGQYRSRSTRF
jgi:L-ascorbate metabolism protein UlaG (beta-lactamase superfamily)